MEWQIEKIERARILGRKKDGVTATQVSHRGWDRAGKAEKPESPRTAASLECL